MNLVLCIWLMIESNLSIIINQLSKSVLRGKWQLPPKNTGDIILFVTSSTDNIDYILYILSLALIWSVAVSPA